MLTARSAALGGAGSGTRSGSSQRRRCVQRGTRSVIAGGGATVRGSLGVGEEHALHVLLANAAAVPATQCQTTIDGYEMTFAIHHLDHFLLTTRLLPLLITGIAHTGKARGVVVSSCLHKPGSLEPRVDFHFDDSAAATALPPDARLQNRKLANVWFTYERVRHVRNCGITARALCSRFVPK